MPGAFVATSVAMEQRDAITFQRWIWERQHPSDCSQTVGAFTRQDYFYVLGLGAQMVSLKFNFVQALLQKQVYHFPTSHYVNPLRCPSRSFGCYFMPPTNCTRAQHRRTEPVKIHWCFDLPRRRLSRLAGLEGVHSKAWYNAQFAAYLYRPNAELRALGRELLANMEGTRGPAGGGGGGGATLPGSLPVHQGVNRGRANGSCVAVHIRRTDKHTEDHRTAQRRCARVPGACGGGRATLVGGGLVGGGSWDEGVQRHGGLPSLSCGGARVTQRSWAHRRGPRTGRPALGPSSAQLS